MTHQTDSPFRIAAQITLATLAIAGAAWLVWAGATKGPAFDQWALFSAFWLLLGISLPGWLLFVGRPVRLTIPAALRRRARRRRRGLCPCCAYNLGWQFGRGCPECGWNRPPAESHR